MRVKFVLYLLIFITLNCFGSIDDSKWIDDIEFLKIELPKLHKNVYHTISKKDFENNISLLKDKVSQLNDYEIVIELTKIISKIGDSHTTLRVDNSLAFNFVPINFTIFDNGLFVTSIESQKIDFLKARVLYINNISVDSIFLKFRELISYENEFWLKTQLPKWINRPQLFYYYKLSNNIDSISYTFDNGAVLKLGNIKNDEKLKKIDKSFKPLWMNNPKSNYWYKVNHDYIYLQYNICAEDKTYPFNNYVEDVANLLDSLKIRKIVIDLRLNAGGNSEIIKPLVQKIKKLKGKQDFKIYVCISRNTFSSGLMAALEFKKELNCILIGEPTGGSPVAYGNVKSFILPNSKITINCSTKHFKLLNTTEKTINPDIRINFMSADFFNGFDPVIEYILKK